jgi:DNA polymerase III epsilon subunit-like protein
MGLSYYIIDTETNGLGPQHEIVDISIIRCSDRHQLTKRIICEKPHLSQKMALEITGRTMESLSEGQPKEEVVEIVEEFMAKDGLTPDSRCIVCYNASFDKRFLHALWAKVGKEFPAHNWMCAMKFAKQWAKTVGNPPENYKLHSVLAFAKIKPLPGLHAADADSRNTYLLWKKGMDEGINHLTSLTRDPHKLIKTAEEDEIS